MENIHLKDESGLYDNIKMDLTEIGREYGRGGREGIVTRSAALTLGITNNRQPHSKAFRLFERATKLTGADKSNEVYRAL